MAGRSAGRGENLNVGVFSAVVKAASVKLCMVVASFEPLPVHVYTPAQVVSRSLILFQAHNDAGKVELKVG